MVVQASGLTGKNAGLDQAASGNEHLLEVLVCADSWVSVTMFLFGGLERNYHALGDRPDQNVTSIMVAQPERV
jgi:hypothetical protein